MANAKAQLNQLVPFLTQFLRTIKPTEVVVAATGTNFRS
jgi:hypothetical protein